MFTDENKNIICIGCPKGCSINVRKIKESNEIESFEIKGNSCKIGKQYAYTEVTNPHRTLTCTVKVKGGKMPLVPAKTDKEIPKNLQLLCMEIIKRKEILAPVKIGEILIPDILGTGSNIVACDDVAEVK